MARSVYMTAGTKQIIDFMVENRNKHFCVDEIAAALPDTAKSSVYRIVAKLHSEGLLRRFETEGMSSFVYQYIEQTEDCAHHFHLKCEQCGRIIHMECSELEKTRNHIAAEHGFIIGTGNSIIYGVCSECRGDKGGLKCHH
jgi:Fur family ferric uptake transcriptional regulator